MGVDLLTMRRFPTGICRIVMRRGRQIAGCPTSAPVRSLCVFIQMHPSDLPASLQARVAGFLCRRELDALRLASTDFRYLKAEWTVLPHDCDLEQATSRCRLHTLSGVTLCPQTLHLVPQLKGIQWLQLLVEEKHAAYMTILDFAHLAVLNIVCRVNPEHFPWGLLGRLPLQFLTIVDPVGRLNICLDSLLIDFARQNILSGLRLGKSLAQTQGEIDCIATIQSLRTLRLHVNQTVDYTSLAALELERLDLIAHKPGLAPNLSLRSLVGTSKAQVFSLGLHDQHLPWPRTAQKISWTTTLIPMCAPKVRLQELDALCCSCRDSLTRLSDIVSCVTLERLVLNFVDCGPVVEEVQLQRNLAQLGAIVARSVPEKLTLWSDGVTASEARLGTCFFQSDFIAQELELQGWHLDGAVCVPLHWFPKLEVLTISVLAVDCEDELDLQRQVRAFVGKCLVHAPTVKVENAEPSELRRTKATMSGTFYR